MTDKEVGELWLEHTKVWIVPDKPIKALRACLCSRCRLLRKLVKERAQNHFWALGRGKQPSEFIEMALHDFDIDPGTF